MKSMWNWKKGRNEPILDPANAEEYIGWRGKSINVHCTPSFVRATCEFICSLSVLLGLNPRPVDLTPGPSPSSSRYKSKLPVVFVLQC